MRLSSGIWLLLMVGLMMARIEPAGAEPQYRERVEYFDISGHVNSRREMWQAIWDWGPSQSLGQSIVGQAQPRIGYSFKLRRHGNQCKFSKLDVSVAVRIRLPAWDLKDFAKPDLQQYFGCILRTVTVHEKRHAQIAYEAAERIESEFLSTLNGTSCEGFAKRAEELYGEILSDHGRRQRAFDERDYARKRYQQCDGGSQGPDVSLNSKPRPSRYAVQSVPTKRVDAPDADNGGNAGAARAARGEERAAAGNVRRRTEVAESGQREAMVFETTSRLFGSAGVVLVAAASVFGLFAAFMWGASSYEKRRELDGLVGPDGGDDVDREGPGPSTRPVAGRRPPSGMASGGRGTKPSGFGKRGR